MATFKTNCTGRDIEDAVLSIVGIVEDLKYIIANYVDKKYLRNNYTDNNTLKNTYATIDYVNKKINEITSSGGNTGEKV